MKRREIVAMRERRRKRRARIDLKFESKEPNE
jgi:hypothetical protein